MAEKLHSPNQKNASLLRPILYTVILLSILQEPVRAGLSQSAASTLPESTTNSIPPTVTVAPQSPDHVQNLPDYNANTNHALYHENISDSWGPYFNQHDSRWNSVHLGTSNKVTIGGEGCLVSDLAMVWSHLSHKTHTPLEVNAHKEWFGDNQISLKDPLPTLDGHKPIEYNLPHDGQSLDFLHQKVRQGYTLIVELKWNKSEGGVAYHYVVVTGLDSKGHFIINDPWFGDNMHVPYGNHWGNNNLTYRAWAYK